jgi:hypothetical protein
MYKAGENETEADNYKVIGKAYTSAMTPREADCILAKANTGYYFQYVAENTWYNTTI